MSKNLENKESHWIICQECLGQGKKRRKLKKKVKLNYLNALAQFENSNHKGTAPIKPIGALYNCLNCNGSGLLISALAQVADNENYPHIAIVGGGIGGVALAVACLHRGIPFTLYERDKSFDARSQGYGLTLQQASKAMKGFGVFSLEEGVISTRHLVHNTEGKVIGEWGIRKWLESNKDTSTKPRNIHIPRQSLRLALLNQLGGSNKVKWGHKFIDCKENSELELRFDVSGKIKNVKADLVVGADGIRSSVRNSILGDEINPLQYLGCIVILGICSLESLEGTKSSLLDSATVFQTVNGKERIYVMPFSKDSVMWQLSFPMPEKEAKLLSAQGVKALKKEAIQRTNWHMPIPQIIKNTQESLITGYPVYDRELLSSYLMKDAGAVTLLGDAAHPMSPFKGQGANQALLDSLALARKITISCRQNSKWRQVGLRKSVLSDFESEMMKRTAIKVKDSAEAVKLLHSDAVLHNGSEPRGRSLGGND